MISLNVSIVHGRLVDLLFTLCVWAWAWACVSVAADQARRVVPHSRRRRRHVPVGRTGLLSTVYECVCVCLRGCARCQGRTVLRPDLSASLGLCFCVSVPVCVCVSVWPHTGHIRPLFGLKRAGGGQWAEIRSGFKMEPLVSGLTLAKGQDCVLSPLALRLSSSPSDLYPVCSGLILVEERTLMVLMVVVHTHGAGAHSW